MQGANKELYKTLVQKFDMEFTASGGVNSIEDLVKLKENGVHSAIIGKAYYVGAIDLKKALEAVK
jgi:phosphoribosylformimino-5-aminoimidazole carboxamide ribotide isomerase